MRSTSSRPVDGDQIVPAGGLRLDQHEALEEAVPLDPLHRGTEARGTLRMVRAGVVLLASRVREEEHDHVRQRMGPIVELPMSAAVPRCST